MNIVLAIAIVSVIGLVGAAILVVAAKYLTVEEDPALRWSLQPCLVPTVVPAAMQAVQTTQRRSLRAKAETAHPGRQKTADAVAALMAEN